MIFNAMAAGGGGSVSEWEDMPQGMVNTINNAFPNGEVNIYYAKTDGHMCYILAYVNGAADAYYVNLQSYAEYLPKTDAIVFSVAPGMPGESMTSAPYVSIITDTPGSTNIRVGIGGLGMATVSILYPLF